MIGSVILYRAMCALQSVCGWILATLLEVAIILLMLASLAIVAFGIVFALLFAYGIASEMVRDLVARPRSTPASSGMDESIHRHRRRRWTGPTKNGPPPYPKPTPPPPPPKAWS